VKRGALVCRPDKEDSERFLWAVLGRKQYEKWSQAGLDKVEFGRSLQVGLDKVELGLRVGRDMTVRRGHRQWKNFAMVERPLLCAGDRWWDCLVLV